MKARHGIIFGSLFVILLLAALPAVALSEDDAGREKDGTAPPDSGAVKDGRHFTFDRGLHSVWMESIVGRSGMTSAVSFSLKAHDGLHAHYSSGFRSSDFSEGIDAGVSVLGVVEYIDGNGNGVYDPLVDRIASTLPLSSRFHDLEFIPNTDIDPEPPVDDDRVEYKKGYGIGYAIGLRWGAHDSENGLEYDPNPRDHLKEYLKDDDTADAAAEEVTAPLEIVDIQEKDDGTIVVTVVIDGEKVTESFPSKDEAHRWLEAFKDRMLPPDTPEGPGPFIKGLVDGYMAGYDEGYGIDAYDESAATRGDKEKNDDAGRKGGMDPYPIKRPRTFFKPLEVRTEQYDQDSYHLAYHIADRTGVFHAAVGIKGDLYGHGVVIPDAVHLIMWIEDYEFTSRSGRLAIIATSGASYSIHYANPATDAERDGPVREHLFPMTVTDGSSTDVPVKVTYFFKHYEEWEDLHGHGWSARYGLILNLPGWNDTDPEEDDASDLSQNPSEVSDGSTTEKASAFPMVVTMTAVAGSVLAILVLLGAAGHIAYRKLK